MFHRCPSRRGTCSNYLRISPNALVTGYTEACRVQKPRANSTGKDPASVAWGFTSPLSTLFPAPRLIHGSRENLSKFAFVPACTSFPQHLFIMILFFLIQVLNVSTNFWNKEVLGRTAFLCCTRCRWTSSWVECRAMTVLVIYHQRIILKCLLRDVLRKRRRFAHQRTISVHISRSRPWSPSFPREWRMTQSEHMVVFSSALACSNGLASVQISVFTPGVNGQS